MVRGREARSLIGFKGREVYESSDLVATWTRTITSDGDAKSWAYDPQLDAFYRVDGKSRFCATPGSGRRAA
jgi:hypothetical protein